ncbi:MAG: DEAD/DEAH box helicase [Candidatus Omnitrophica bacterium]|nr:DEAD/DEAH box helicase [Candidatus Omnitrophota bacterium]
MRYHCENRKELSPKAIFLKIQDKTAIVLEQGGIISQKLQNYEFRPQQLQMARAVAEAIEADRHLIVEAGTGIGKSLAYLIPFIIYTIENNKKVVVSTNTKTLQNQLYLKDLPFLKKSLGVAFNYALCLGSENYLCLRRLGAERTYELFEAEAQFKELKEILEWSSKTESGLKSDLGFIPKHDVWDNVCRDPDLCLGKKCLYKEKCFYRKAKTQERKAHILVTNHSLFFTNLTLGGNVLPSFDAIVFDEAQTLEDIATSYLGFEASNTKIKYLFDSIYNPKTQKGLLVKFRSLSRKTAGDIENQLLEARQASDQFFHDINKIFGSESDSKRIRTKNIIFNFLEEPLKHLSGSLSELLDYIKNEEDAVLINSYLKRINRTTRALSFILNHDRVDYVYWIEIFKKRRGIRYSLFAAPIEIAEELEKQLFSQIKPIILTSATLATKNDFKFIKKRLGIKDCDEQLLDSPFNYSQNVLLYLAKKIEDPNDKFEIFQMQVLEHIKKIIDIMKGRIFILFTSYRMLNTIFNKLMSNYADINLLKQGDKPRYELLKDFKRSANSVLLGTSTFWQGVDVPGKPLECVIITKLPFAVPDDPITEARLELIESRGGKPFPEYQVPQAIMMFKQGFGRLVRTKSDRGVVAVLDPRINTKGYGKSFIRALPKCRCISDIDEINNFFHQP